MIGPTSPGCQPEERLEIVQGRFPLPMIEDVDAACNIRIDKLGRSAKIRKWVAL